MTRGLVVVLAMAALVNGVHCAPGTYDGGGGDGMYGDGDQGYEGTGRPSNMSSDMPSNELPPSSPPSRPPSLPPLPVDATLRYP